VNRDGHFGGRILTPGLGTHPILMRKFGILLLVEQKLVLLLFAEVTKNGADTPLVFRMPRWSRIFERRRPLQRWR
jgi:hypothetical protein